MVWRSGTDAGRLGNNKRRVCESILGTWMSQNLSRGSDSLDQLLIDGSGTAGCCECENFHVVVSGLVAWFDVMGKA